MESTSLITSNTKSSILRFVFESCWDVFLTFLSNLEIAKLDLILTDLPLRKLFFCLVNDFYLINKIYDYKELDWILNNNISLSKCHLEFRFKGKIILQRCCTYLNVIYNSNNLELHFQVQSMKPSQG